VHAALETPVPAQAEAGTYETYPYSAIEEAVPEPGFNAFLPQRRPAVPHPAVPHPGDDAQPRRVPAPVPAVRHQPLDLALLDRVLGSLQRMA
jgi:hypothetical protein